MHWMHAFPALAWSGIIHQVSASDNRDLNGLVWDADTTSHLGARQAGSADDSSQWDPPSSLVQPLKEVWDHTVETYNNGDIFGFNNYGYDILMAAQGKLQFCVRWDSGESVTAEQRAAIEQSLDVNVRKWTDHLSGFMGFPYYNVSSSVVGWAVRDANQLSGKTDSEPTTVYTATRDADNIPECDPRCGRFFHRDDNDYSSCPQGAAGRYDMSLWLTAGMGGGAGGDWGQRVGAEYFLGALDNPHIWLHEFGHTLALDDFYDWTPTGVTSFIMKAGAAFEVTEFDVWMMRDWWRNLKNRYDLASVKGRRMVGMW